MYLTTQNDGLQDSGQVGALPQIVVTYEMIAAGLDELRDHKIGDDLAYIVENVYRAMAYASVPASSTNEVR
jgi:hypothetical protein